MIAPKPTTITGINASAARVDGTRPENRAWLAELGVRGFPTLVGLRAGKFAPIVAARFDGARRAAPLVAFVRQLAAMQSPLRALAESEELDKFCRAGARAQRVGAIAALRAESAESELAPLEVTLKAIVPTFPELLIVGLLFVSI